MEVKMIMPVSENFNLEKAVCNHGFFMMAPNRWMPSQKSLIRPLRIISNDNNSDDLTVIVSIAQPQNENFILITGQVARMLRISDKDELMVKEFHSVHLEAKKMGFARIFRSPTLFEDIVKSVLLCYCSLGFRASIIIQVAQSIENGSLNLEDFERPDSSPQFIRQRLIKIKGFGPFTIANIFMCIGFYHQIPVDTETIKHLEQDGAR
ncbi:hypothetical protein DH2020_003923 [Rehmannia glutinosa]|uniref:HhH-GPD domain-containing protein n=1 Tax=Rehmannia glutinosa TaxID=99300 RepID=A0ABR0XN20_REHGL